MPELNVYTAPVLFAALLNTAFLIILFLRRTWEPIHRVFALWTTAIAIWNFGSFGVYGAKEASTAILWNWICYYGIALVPATFLDLILTLRQSSTRVDRLVLRTLYALGLGLIAVNTWKPQWLVAGVVERFWGWGPVGGPATLVLDPAVVFGSLYALVRLYDAIRKTEGPARVQLEYVFYSALIAFIGGGINVAVVHGVHIYPLGNLFNMLYSIGVAYAILGLGMLNIRILLEQGTVYGVMCGALTLVYISIVGIMKKLFGYSISDEMFFYMAAMPLTVVLAPTMKKRIEPWVQHWAHGDSPVDPRDMPAAALKPLQQAQMDNMRLIGMVSTELAHELAKPLTQIVNEGARLEKGLFQSYKESIARIDREARRVSQIVDSFAVLSPDRELECEPVDITHLLEEALVSVNIKEDPSFHIVRHYAELPPVRVHPILIAQILSNIFHNAVQAMPEGGTLELTTVSLPNGKYRVEIADTGHGVSPEILSRAFEPFVTTKAATGGRGVGLTISRAMTERHGGTIQIESPVREGRGTRIILEMPCSPVQKTA